MLARFSRRRTTAANPLHVSLSDLMQSQSHLYSYMQFLKAQDSIHVLQLLLSLGMGGWGLTRPHPFCDR